MSVDNKKYCEQIVRTYLKHLEPNGSTVIMSGECNIDQLGKCICGLANLALYRRLPYAYALWGVNPKERKLTGTKINLPTQANLSMELSIRAVYSLSEVVVDDTRVLVLEVQSAAHTPMQYKGIEYIFNRGTLSFLSNYPEIEKELWKKGDTTDSFESKTAKNNVSAEDIVSLLDCQKLFSMLSLNYPKNLAEIIAKLIELRFVSEKNTGKFTITNLGALLLAKRLKRFDTVEYKAVRVLQFDGLDVTNPAKEQIGSKGYIVGFEGLIDYIMSKLPTSECIDGAIRKNICIYPILPIRELVANALIHQDLNENGAPIVSIFPDRIEITNPGKPLIRFDRFIDYPPYSRNETLAAAMRKVGICEERGSGYDKVISCVEKYNLPVPDITEYDRSTKVTLFAKKEFDKMTKEERIAACYAHVSLNYVRNTPSNNGTLRVRFQLGENERYKISRVFNDTRDAKLIRIRDGTGMKNREYIPYWAPDEKL